DHRRLDTAPIFGSDMGERTLCRPVVHAAPQRSAVSLSVSPVSAVLRRVRARARTICPPCFRVQMDRERTPLAPDLSVECLWPSRRAVYFVAPGVHALPDAGNQKLCDGGTSRRGGRPSARSKAILVSGSPPCFHRAKESQADDGLRR